MFTLRPLVFLLSLLSLHGFVHAQTNQQLIQVVDVQNAAPVAGAIVYNQATGKTTLTNEGGFFFFTPALQPNDTLQITALEYETKKQTAAAFILANNKAALQRKTIALSEIVVTAAAANPFTALSKADLRLRGINNAQEVLRMVPGLFIGQHAGGGKAEQIFLRGFDIDHGTDVSIGVDGMPVNMVSHAHGQGYADLHFLIPELIEEVNFEKGTYDAGKGNFATAGSVDFRTLSALPRNSIKLEGGMFNTFRTVGMFNLLKENVKAKGQSAYIASEYMYSDGYFDNPQKFNRYNVFGKYFGAIGKRNLLELSAAHFTSSWNASGQIPERAVRSGLIGFYGAIDPNEGGKTSRSSINASLVSTLKDGSYFKNGVYFSRYAFDLFSNFTFFKEDSVNGDQIRQKEQRNLVGYNGSYHKAFHAGRVQIISEAGAQLRIDRTYSSELSRTKNRTLVTAPLMLGDVSEMNAAVYMAQTFLFSSRFTMNTGVRYDHFTNAYADELNGGVKDKAAAGILSPKISFQYTANNRMQFYLKTGKGFHANDTRVVVPQNGLQVLPAAYGADLGTVLKPTQSILVNAALWALHLQQEFVYVGDEGIVEPVGKSKRYGADLSVRYQPLTWLYADVDLSYAHARAVDAPKGQDYLPLAPQLTSSGGVTLKTSLGINASLRYRYMGNRPANEDNTVLAKGYFVTDFFLTYRRNKYEVALSVQNLFNTKWKETQFETESRLQHEPVPVSEIHFTPGTPFFARLGFTYIF